MASIGVPSPELTLRFHVRILSEPLHYTIEEMVGAARRVFATAGIRVELASVQHLDRPSLLMVEIGRCVRGAVTEDQERLFRERDGVPEGEIVVYFVLATYPESNGCAAHPPGRPGAVVAETATRWTMAHELGHVLGLGHVAGRTRLMIGAGTEWISKDPPDLVEAEISELRSSPLLRESEV
ncbi:hypothetical protein [Longimicrobium sp.]|uniref:hypothetical protein n=1 Tax=Longimicrobium sp. TaxID=2029185 RepID=UPI002BFB84E4|nr:hypothetical protein [Longimicrobium sp.]HSU12686.1 hypothetical protein [Longimicrobium sp.]